MKNLLLTFIVACLTMAQLVAQEPVFVKGDKVLNLGIGLGSSLILGTYYTTQIPRISASVEVGVADNIIDKGVIGVGGYFGFSSYKYEYAQSGWKTSNIIIGARGNLHYPLVDKLDTYAGLMIGYRILGHSYFGIYDDDDYSGLTSGLQWSLFIGGRYYFKENFAAMLELGYGVAYINLGIALKF